MLPYYLFAAFLFFGSRNDDRKGVHERTGRNVLRSGGTQLAERGDACAKFERRAPELCMMTSREVKLDLTIMMANCQLETVGAPPLQYDNSKDMAKGSEADKIIVMQMLSKLPLFCQSLATYGLNINYMSLQSTMDIVNSTYEKLDEITKIAGDFEEENKRSILQTERLLEVSEESLRQSKNLSENSEEMKQKLANFSDDMTTMQNAFAGFERGLGEFVEKEEQIAELIKNYTEEAQEMIQNMDLTAYEDLENQLQFEILQYQILLVAIVAWYVMSKASVSAIGIFAFMLVVFLIAALSTMRFGSILAMYRTVKQLSKTVSYLSDTSLNLNQLIAVAAGMILIPVLFSFIRRFFRRKGRKFKDLQQNIYENFDSHNSRDVLALLQEQGKFIEQQKAKIERLLAMTNSAIDISKQEEPAFFCRPVQPSRAFYRSKWRRSPVAKRYFYEDPKSESSPSFTTHVTDIGQINQIIEKEVKQAYTESMSDKILTSDATVEQEEMEPAMKPKTIRSTSRKKHSRVESEIEPIQKEFEMSSTREADERKDETQSKVTAQNTTRTRRIHEKPEIESTLQVEMNQYREEKVQEEASKTKATRKPSRKRDKHALLPGGPMPPSPRATVYTSEKTNEQAGVENQKIEFNTSWSEDTDKPSSRRNKRKSEAQKPSALEKMSRRVTKSVKKTLAAETGNETESASKDGPASGRRRSKRIKAHKQK